MPDRDVLAPAWRDGAWRRGGAWRDGVQGTWLGDGIVCKDSDVPMGTWCEWRGGGPMTAPYRGPGHGSGIGTEQVTVRGSGPCVSDSVPRWAGFERSPSGSLRSERRSSVPGDSGRARPRAARCQHGVGAILGTFSGHMNVRENALFHFYFGTKQGSCGRLYVMIEQPNSFGEDARYEYLSLLDSYPPNHATRDRFGRFNIGTLFDACKVQELVRCCEPLYDRHGFEKAGIAVADLYCEEDIPPTVDVISKFLAIAERLHGAIAVHGGEGSGWSGALVALYMMKHHGFKSVQCPGGYRMAIDRESVKV